MDPYNRCYDAFITADKAETQGIEASAYQEAGLLTHEYWNGKTWQEEVCWVPHASDVNEP